MLQNLVLQHLLFFCPYFLLRKIIGFHPSFLAYARATRAHYRDFMFFAVTSVTPYHIITCILHNYVLFCDFTLIPRKEFADFTPKTTRCFMKNDTSFYEKPHVVLWKTTRRFVKNHTSFYEKLLIGLSQKSLIRTIPQRDKSSHFFNFQPHSTLQCF